MLQYYNEDVNKYLDNYNSTLTKCNILTKQNVLPSIKQGITCRPDKVLYIHV